MNKRHSRTWQKKMVIGPTNFRSYDLFTNDEMLLVTWWSVDQYIPNNWSHIQAQCGAKIGIILFEEWKECSWVWWRVVGHEMKSQSKFLIMKNISRHSKLLPIAGYQVLVKCWTLLILLFCFVLFLLFVFLWQDQSLTVLQLQTNLASDTEICLPLPSKGWD